jgi:CheY-like chemotaxis protein
LRVSDTPAHHASLPDVSLTGISVLVVDDNATNRRILVETLSKWGMLPEAATGAGEALDLLAAAHASGKPFSIILTDANMPQTDGFALIEQVKKHSQFSTATIMMLTSGGQVGDADRCRQLGVSSYLTKPVRAVELRSVIGRLAAEHSLGRPASKNEIFSADQDGLGNRRAGTTAPLRILLAEDNAVNKHLAMRILQKQGHRVILAENGRKAVAELERQPVDLVLMDIQMPEMDGREATALIRERERGTGRHLPIIALTAHAMREDKQWCLAAGMDAYISKPLRARDLIELVERFRPDANGARSLETADC